MKVIGAYYSPIYWIRPKIGLEVKHMHPIHDMFMCWFRGTSGNVIAYYN